jgi:hypothetical protein
MFRILLGVRDKNCAIQSVASQYCGDERHAGAAADRCQRRLRPSIVRCRMALAPSLQRLLHFTCDQRLPMSSRLPVTTPRQSTSRMPANVVRWAPAVLASSRAVAERFIGLQFRRRGIRRRERCDNGQLSCANGRNIVSIRYSRNFGASPRGVRALISTSLQIAAINAAWAISSTSVCLRSLVKRTRNAPTADQHQADAREGVA